MRTNRVKQLTGGLAALFSALLNNAFKDFRWAAPEGRDEVAVTFDLSKFLADEVAEMALWGFKGHGALKPCWECSNVTDFNHLRAQRDASGLLRHLGCSNFAEFALNSDAAIYGIVEALRVQSQRPRGKTRLGEMETELGFCWIPQGVLADLTLRQRISPTEGICRDPAHILLLGLVPLEVFKLAERMEATTPYTWGDWGNYCANLGWHIPGSNSHKMKACFSERRAQSSKEAGHYKGGASDILSFYRLLALFSETVLSRFPAMASAIESFQATCDLIDARFGPMRVRMKRQSVSPPELAALVRRRQELFFRTYEDMRPVFKDHQAHHLAPQLARDGRLHNTLPTERKIRQFKTVVRHSPPGEGWEKMILQRVLLQQSHNLKTFVATAPIHLVDEGLLDRDDPLVVQLAALAPGLRRAFGSKQALVHDMPARVKDGLVCQKAPGQEKELCVAEFFLRLECGDDRDGCYVAGRPCAKLPSNQWGTRATFCRVEAAVQLYKLEWVLASCIWAPSGEQNLVALWRL